LDLAVSNEWPINGGVRLWTIVDNRPASRLNGSMFRLGQSPGFLGARRSTP